MSYSALARTATILLALTCLTPAAASSHATPVDRAAERRQEKTALDAAVRDLCRKDMVLIGENGFHGDGRTNGFKADLVRRLVQSCGFDAVFFEASHYDFLEIARRQREGGGVLAEHLSSAIGGVWNQNEEMAPLVAFLQTRVAAGRLAVGGLDDQLGVRGAFYSLDLMPEDLAAQLPEGRRETCAGLIRQRVWSRYSKEEPYDEAARSRVSQCLTEVREAARRAAPERRAEIEQMVAAFQRALGRDFLTGPARLADRDRSMFATLQWLVSRLPARSKVIVWAANGHVQKAAGLSAATPNLGTLAHQAYGDRAFVLGFTAASGSFRWNVRTARDIPPAPPESLEARALRDGRSQVAYLGPRALAAEGMLSGAAGDDHQQVVARWSDLYDGMIVFRTERPPRRSDE